MDLNIKETLDLLELAKDKLSNYLKGKNKRGLITNITNAAYDIKKYYAEVEKKSDNSI